MSILDVFRKLLLFSPHELRHYWRIAQGPALYSVPYCLQSALNHSLPWIARQLLRPHWSVSGLCVYWERISSARQMQALAPSTTPRENDEIPNRSCGIRLQWKLLAKHILYIVELCRVPATLRLLKMSYLFYFLFPLVAGILHVHPSWSARCFLVLESLFQEHRSGRATAWKQLPGHESHRWGRRLWPRLPQHTQRRPGDRVVCALVSSIASPRLSTCSVGTQAVSWWFLAGYPASSALPRRQGRATTHSRHVAHQQTLVGAPWTPCSKCAAPIARRWWTRLRIWLQATVELWRILARGASSCIPWITLVTSPIHSCMSCANLVMGSFSTLSTLSSKALMKSWYCMGSPLKTGRTDSGARSKPISVSKLSAGYAGWGSVYSSRAGVLVRLGRISSWCCNGTVGGNVSSLLTLSLYAAGVLKASSGLSILSELWRGLGGLDGSMRIRGVPVG